MYLTQAAILNIRSNYFLDYEKTKYLVNKPGRILCFITSVTSYTLIHANDMRILVTRASLLGLFPKGTRPAQSTETVKLPNYYAWWSKNCPRTRIRWTGLNGRMRSLRETGNIEKHCQLLR